MKLKYIKEDDLNAIKANQSNIFNKILYTKSQTLSEFFSNDSIIRESDNFQFDDFELVTPDYGHRESQSDAENVKRLYSKMKSLTDSQASDERIWVAYTLHEFRDYMLYRWGAENEKILKNRYLFGYSPQESLFRNGIARLWWIGRFTYDETRSDPFELTDYLCSHQDYINNICGRNIFNNPTIGHTTIEALIDAEKAGIEVNTDTVREIGKYVNLLGSMFILDALDRDKIYEKLQRKLGF